MRRLIEYTSWSGLWHPILRFALVFFVSFWLLAFVFFGTGHCVTYSVPVACGSTSEYVKAPVNILVYASTATAQSLNLSSQLSGSTAHSMAILGQNLYFWVSGMTDGSGNERVNYSVSTATLTGYGVVSCELSSEKFERVDFVQGLVAVACAALLWAAIILGMRS